MYTNGVSAMQFNQNHQDQTSNYVMTMPHVYLIFWGSLWNDASTKDLGGYYTNAQARNLLKNFFKALGGTPWADTLTQYCQGPGVSQGSTFCAANSTYITNPAPLVTDNQIWVDTVNPLPPTVDAGAAETEASNAYTHGFTDINAIYMIFTPSRKLWDMGRGCAWHSHRSSPPYVTFSLVPYEPDQGYNCYQNDVNPPAPSSGGYGDGYFDGLTIAAAHEYAENVTDPYFGGWFDSTGLSGEIGDKCAAPLNPIFNLGTWVSYLIPLGNVWLSGVYYAIQGIWSNADNACVIPFDNKDHMYLLDGYGGIHPSGSAPALSSPDYLGYDIARGLAFYVGATGGYWMDGYGHLHPIGNVLSPNSVTGVPSWGFDIARAIWPAPWGTPNYPAGYILDGYGGITQFFRGQFPAPHIPSPHYTQNVDIARAIAITPDQNGASPVSGYMLDGYGTMWPVGTAVSVNYPQFSSDIARGVTLLPKTTDLIPGGYILDGDGGLHPFGLAPTLTRYTYWPNWDIARSVTSWTFDSTSWRYSSTSHVGGWDLDGYGGLHSYQNAPDVASNVYWQNWDIARADTGSEAGSGAR